ncbi:ARF guanine-nucleotide exchange factor GNOM [Babesia sp. Xinjiang]|uniref:ARF guanine-nucleotide exchange factor GNOM n=1 Tax=Babesia sp. Xinjiang TaxID=462227 RepID=UPI000A262E4F|nr:ARF guanine-nucleotide exchange factor GNOM [Babesia sp. Xinjiang]ORM40073.1 ARF guanine-nucleotide exchange factor GNOM [Babesia sp. Xinjiang]
MENHDRLWVQTEEPRRIEVVKLEAYHVLAALKDYLRNSSTTSSLVPVLGVDSSSGKALHEPALTRYFKILIVKGVPSEDIFMDIAHIRPFIEVMKMCDTKQSKLIILCAEAISKFTQCEYAKFNHKNVPNVINTTFEELVALFTTNVEPKDDLPTLKILKTLNDILNSKAGNLVTNENICLMLKMIATLLTARQRNISIRKLVHDEIVNLLQASLGHYDRTIIKLHKLKNLSRRVSSTFIFLSLLLAQTTTHHPFAFYPEDSFLSPDDKETVNRFRHDLAMLSQNVVAFPSLWNEFCSEVCIVGLETLNKTMEFGSLSQRQYNMVLPIVQVFMANSIYRMCFTESLGLYSLVLRTLKNMLFYFRAQMKAQIEAQLTHIIASVINHRFGTKAYSFKADIIEMSMEFIVDLCHNIQIIIELYANYDCDVRCANMADVLIRGVIECLVPNYDLEATDATNEQIKLRTLPSKGNSKKKGTSNSARIPGENSSAMNLEYMALSAIQGILKALASDKMESSVHETAEQDTHFARQKKWKDTLKRAADIFNTTKLGDEWIPLVKDIGLLPMEHEPKDIANFLKCVPELDLKKVGEYLGTHKNPTFMDQVRTEFAKLHSFRGLPIVMAIRLFLSSFRLPGESQQIERIIEVFAATYFEAQPLVKDNEQDSGNETANGEDIPESKKPRWVVQENVFWQLNFTCYGVTNLGTINDHIAAEDEEPYEHFTRQFMQNEIENILTNERINLVTEAMRDPSVVAAMQLTNLDSTQQEDDTKLAKYKDPSTVEGTLKPGFAYVANVDVIFVLSYSIIMLNTDLHNTQIKKKMKLEDFVRNNKGINNGKNLPYEFLEDIYTTIKYHEIKLHKGNEQVEVVKYDNFFWVDHVLHRQRLMGSFNTDLRAHGWEIKRSIFHLLCENNFCKALNVALYNSQSIAALKRCVRLLWLFTRVAMKFGRSEEINRIFQMNTITIDETLGYKCQLSLAFILTLIASASNMFDRVSWVKVLDTVSKLYYLNLLPLSFAALDIDAQVYGNCATLTDALVPPTIRFKRNMDIKRGAGWLGGWTNFITFTKPATPNNSEQSDYYDGELDETPNVDDDERKQTQQQFLFLYDIQSGCDNPVENPYFDIHLIKRGVKPIASQEDEEAIKEVTQAFSNEADKEELLPQVLGYMNLRLAFLNIYNVDRLFVGAATNVDAMNYMMFIKVIALRIVEAAVKEKEVHEVAKVNNGTHAPQGQATQGHTKVETIFSMEGALLDPCPKEMKHFGNKAEPSFCLGIFTKISIVVMEQTRAAIEGLNADNDLKFKFTLVILVKYFYLFASTLILPEALEHIPKPEDVLGKLGLMEDYKHLELDDDLGKLGNITNKLVQAVRSDTVLSSYLCIMMLKVVLWLTQNASDDAIVIRRESCHGTTKSSPSQDVKWSDLCLWLSAWLLQMLIHFDNRIFYNHIEPIVKVLSTVATTSSIAKNEYSMSVIMAALQRVVNHDLPFAKEGANIRPGAARNRRILNTVGAILPVLLGNLKAHAADNVHLVGRLTTQTLLFLIIATGRTQKTADDDYNQGVQAIQLLTEIRSSGTDNNTVEAYWLYVVHALSIICAVGRQRVYIEAMKALTKMLLKEAGPTGRCAKIIQVVRIFDYILAPILTNNFQYPLPYDAVAMPITMMTPQRSKEQGVNWEIMGVFSRGYSDGVQHDIWMENFVIEYMKSHHKMDPDDMNTRKAEMTSLICQYMLANLPTLSSMKLDDTDIELVKEKASSLEYLLYSSDQETCCDTCVKRYITITNYILNVIIPSNVGDYTDATSDTYLESLKNFLLVLLTSPELKSAESSCLEHFKNDKELKIALEHVRESVDMASASAGEYVLSSLLAHTFATSDFLKELFLDILKVVFPAPPVEDMQAEENADE